MMMHTPLPVQHLSSSSSSLNISTNRTAGSGGEAKSINTGSPKLVLTTFSNNRTRRRRKEGGGRARALAADRNNNNNNSVDKAVLQIERKQQQPRSIDTLRKEALGQLSSTTISKKRTELTGKKFAGFIAVPFKRKQTREVSSQNTAGTLTTARKRRFLSEESSSPPV